MKATFGSVACHLLRIHTPLEDDVKGAQRDGAWRKHIPPPIHNAPRGCAGEAVPRPPAPAGALGACISAADMVALRQMVEEFTVRSLLPSLEQRVRALNHTVAANRKGLRNQLKTLLWRKAAGDVGGGAGGGGASGYDAASLEAQMHQLAVLSFLIQDYDTSSSTLRLLCSDYRQDKSWRHLAFAQVFVFVWWGGGGRVSVYMFTHLYVLVCLSQTCTHRSTCLDTRKHAHILTHLLSTPSKHMQELLGLAVYFGTGRMPDVASSMYEAAKLFLVAGGPQRTLERQHGRCMMILGQMFRDAGQYRDAHAALMTAHAEVCFCCAVFCFCFVCIFCYVFWFCWVFGSAVVFACAVAWVMCGERTRMVVCVCSALYNLPCRTCNTHTLYPTNAPHPPTPSRPLSPSSPFYFPPTQSREGIRAAVSLEQGSNCLLSMQPPFVRRFAFYTVLAAIRYRQVGFGSLSSKGYALAQQLYKDTPWVCWG